MRSPVDELPCEKNYQCSVEYALPGISLISQGIFKVDTSTCQSWSQLSNSVHRTSGNGMLSKLLPISVLDSIVADSHI